MATYHKPLLLKLFLLIAVWQYALPAQAQLAAKSYPINYITASNDTLATAKEHTESPAIATVTKTLSLYNEDAQLANAETSINKPQERRVLMGHLKQITTVDEVNYNPSRKKFLYG
jgi:hypothetical protein